MAVALRDLIKNPTAAELELVARYAMLPEDPRRERAFSAFAATGLPHRRMEAWKWTDFKAALKEVASPKGKAAADPLASDDAITFTFTPKGVTFPKTLPDGLRMLPKAEALAFPDSEDLPLGAMTAALSGHKAAPGTLLFEVSKPISSRVHFVFTGSGEANFGRIQMVVRKDASIDISESHLGGAGLSSALFEFDVNSDAHVTRTIYQRGGKDEAVNITGRIELEHNAIYEQNVLAFGAKVSRIETRLTHHKKNAKAILNAAYLASDGYHVDQTSFIRHNAPSCVTEQITKGAVRSGGKGIFQGKFFVPKVVGQQTNADMQHHALLLEDGAEVFAKPELEIYADDVECAHGNTCGALDGAALFYMRQRGIPENDARALLTEAFVAEPMAGVDETLRDILLAEIHAWMRQ